MKFLDFIKKYEGKNSPFGDFAGDTAVMLRTKYKGQYKEIKTKEDLRRFMPLMACKEAVKTGNRLFNMWLKKEKELSGGKNE
jgi:hypothetical protein